MYDNVKEIANSFVNEELTCVARLYHFLKFNINNSHGSAMHPLIYSYALGL